jgi:hypothetical protein
MSVVKQLLSMRGVAPLVVFLLATSAFAKPHAVRLGRGSDLTVSIIAEPDI